MAKLASFGQMGLVNTRIKSLGIGFVSILLMAHDELLWAADTKSDTNSVAASETETRKRLESIIIPAVKFDGATLSEVVDFLRKEAAKNSPDGKGVQVEIDLRPSKLELKIPSGIDDELRREILRLDERVRPLQSAETTNTVTYPPITLNVRDIPLYDALQLVTDLSGVRFVVRTNNVLIGRVYGEQEVRVYKLPQKLFDELKEQSHKCFVEPGHQPVHPSMSFIPNHRMLIVINTLENLDIFEKVLLQVDSSVERYPSGEKLK